MTADNSEVEIRLVLKETIEQLVNAIDSCLKKELFIPGLILLYSSIDIMSWLDRKKSHTDVKPSDFIRWAKSYILPNLRTTCQTIDLYSARCALLHSYTAESKLIRKQKAKKIFYAWGPGRAKELQYINDQYGKEQIIVLDIGELFIAFKKGIEDFVKYIQKDANRFKVVNDRAIKFLAKKDLVI